MSVNLIDYEQTNQIEGKPGAYLRIYEKYFAPLRDKPISLLELGVFQGQSMIMWRDYFPHGTIAGLDLNPNWVSDDPRVRIYRGKQDDTDLLSRIASECAPEGFDIIVDDASHIGELTKISFWHLFNHHLKPGGFYAVEDWGTGYWGNQDFYPDGGYFRSQREGGFLRWLARKLIANAPAEGVKLGFFGRLLRRHQYTRYFPSHPYGMAGFAKQLLDEVGISEITNPKHGVENGPMGPARPTRFREYLVTPGVLMVTKA